MGRSRRDRPCPEDENLAEAGPEAAPARHRRRRLPAERTARDPLRRWLGAKCKRTNYADVTKFLPQFKQMAEAADRSPATLPITIFGAPENLDRIQRYRDQELHGS
jgi:hypothetical protein